MKKKATGRVKHSKQPSSPLFGSLVSGLKRLFREDLPVTEYFRTGKFETVVPDAKLYQEELRQLCGGYSARSQKQFARALVTPEEPPVMRVTIDGRLIGHLKPADAKLLLKQLAGSTDERCAVRVDAVIQGGKQKKNGEVEPFTVALRLPPRPERKKPQSEEDMPPETEADE